MSSDNQPITLPLSTQKTCTGENFSSDTHVCNSEKEYDDIFYVTGSNCFWLTKEKATKVINQAVAEFKNKIFAVSEGKDAIPLLSEKGIDMFVSLSPANFLEEKDKARWNELETYRKSVQDRIDNNYQRIQQEDAEKLKKRMPLTFHPLNMDLYRDAQRMRKQQRELDKITEVGFSRAEAEGYLVDRVHAQFFDPRQKKIKLALDKYIKAANIFIEKTKTPKEAIEEIRNWLLPLQEFKCKHTLYGPELDMEVDKLRQELEKMSSAAKALAEGIAELAALGIAVPEYALAGDNGTDSGAKKYAVWFQYLAEKAKFKKEMDQQLNALKISTDRSATPPSEAFRGLISKMAEQQTKADALYQTALDACKKHRPQMLLLWEPKSYKIPEMKCIANPSYPLREIVSTKAPDGTKKIRTDYFSLRDIPLVKKIANPKFKFHVAKNDGDPELEEILTQYGLRKLPLQRSWFNQNGFFVPAAFYQDTIDNKNTDHRIKIKKLQANKKVWEKNITQFLFRDLMQGLFSPVDETAAGAFCRMVSDGVKTTTLKTEVTKSSDPGHPNDKNKTSQKKKTTLFQIAKQTDATFLRGEFELLNATFPENPAPYLLAVDYDTRDAKNNKFAVCRAVDLGAWSFHTVVKCFGFIGATIKLSTSLYGETPMLVPGDRTTQATDSNSKSFGGALEGFVGVQVGASLSGELLWNPPEAMKKQLSPGMKTPIAIGTLNVVAMASFGASMKLPFEIKYKDGKFQVNIKPTFWGGAGFNLAISSDINVAGILLLIELFQDLLHQADYGRIAICDEDTFDVLSNYSLVMLLIMPWAAVGLLFGKPASFQQSVLEVGLLAAKSKTFFEDIIALFNRSENAGLVAYSISGHLMPKTHTSQVNINQTEQALKKWIRLLTPEAIGKVLGTMLAEPRKMNIGRQAYEDDEVRSMQQLTIGRILAWLWDAQACSATSPIADQHRYQEAISRMLTRNPGNNDAQKNAYCRNIRQLDKFINDKIDVNDQNLIKVVKQYQQARKNLSLHLSNWENATLSYHQIGNMNMAAEVWK
jgi:flagellar biosynthesis/type III secretory pathway protein FliH